MVMKKGVGAELKLSVKDALANLEKLNTELNKLRSKKNETLNIKLVIDTSELDTIGKKIKQITAQQLPGKEVGVRSAGGIIIEQLNKIGNVLLTILAEMRNLNLEAAKLQDSLRQAAATPMEYKELHQNIIKINNGIREQRQGLRDAAQEWINAAAAGLRAMGQLTQGAADLLGTYRNFGKELLNGFKSFAESVLETVGFGVTGLVDDAIEQERKLQQSQIGFGNMFPGQDTGRMIQLVRSTAASSPGLNSGDLADYINQLGAVSGGSFDTAFNATMGILKTVQYGGGDANSQMGYIIKNIRDVMAKGKATQVDVQQFNRAMPLLQKSLASIGASEFLKDGELKITKENADQLMEAFARLNTKDNPAYYIFEQTATTLAGLQEEFRETVSSQIATIMESLGVFETLAKVMRETVFPEVESALNTFGEWLRRIKNNIDWGRLGEVAAKALEHIKEAIGSLARVVENNFANTDFLQTVITTIGKFIEGLIGGAAELGKKLAEFKNRMGEEGFNNLAESLGRAVTKGALFQKELEIAGNGLEKFAAILQTLAFGRYLAPGLFGAGSSAGSSGSAGAAASGGMMAQFASGAKSLLGKIVSKAGLGTAFLGISEAAAQAIEQLRFFGDSSTDIANIVDVAGRTISFAIYGSIVGPFGAAAAAAVGLASGLWEAEQRTKQREAIEAENQAFKNKTTDQERVVQAAIETYRSQTGNIFDEETEAAHWVKAQLYEYLQNTPTSEWQAADVYDRFVSAYRQKLGHEAMVEADNVEGFWGMQGEALKFVDTKDGQPFLTDAGQRLAKIIRDYNLVGYSSYNTLMDTAAETLVNQYLQRETLNAAQLDYLEQRASEFEQTVGANVTMSRDKINEAISEAGSIDDAILKATQEGENMWLNTYEAFKKLNDLAGGFWGRSNTDIVWGAARGKIWTDDVAREVLGTQGGELYSKWGEQNGWYKKFFSGDRSTIDTIYGTDDIQEIITRITEAASTARIDKDNEALTELERENATKIFSTYNDFLESFRRGDYGSGESKEDWGKIRDALEKIAVATVMAGSTEIFANKPIGLFGGEWDIKQWINYLKTLNPDLFKAGGGYIRPIFRAGGGLGVDSVPAYLQPGEFVQRASAVSTAGLGVMQALNRGDLSSAYRLIGSKINGTWNQNRNSAYNSDNRKAVYAPTFITERTRRNRTSFYASTANRLALGY